MANHHPTRQSGGTRGPSRGNGSSRARQDERLSQGRDNYGSSDADHSGDEDERYQRDARGMRGSEMVGWREDDRGSNGTRTRREGTWDRQGARGDWGGEEGRGPDMDHNTGREGYGSSGWERQARWDSDAGAGARGDGRGDQHRAMHASRGQHAGKGPRGYTRSDERIREDVSDRLWGHGDVDASGIEVDVQGGEVTLNGTVPERQMKRHAEACLDDCVGVKHVQNNLRWQEPGRQHETAPDRDPGSDEASTGRRAGGAARTGGRKAGTRARR